MKCYKNYFFYGFDLDFYYEKYTKRWEYVQNFSFINLVIDFKTNKTFIPDAFTIISLIFSPFTGFQPRYCA